MPIYGYVCKSCEHELDALQKMADLPLVDCPACGESQLKRQLSAPRFRLKGQGWYETDFKKDNQRNLAGEKEAAKSDKKSDDKTEKKADKKPDAKSTSKASSDSSTKGSSAKGSGSKASAA
jgi:putative FmdB family regulatory protein